MEIQPSRTLEVSTGGQIQLFCSVEVSGVPATISWIRNGQPVGYGPNLYLTNVRSEDQGEYICRAENNAGFIEQTAYIYVISGNTIFLHNGYFHLLSRPNYFVCIISMQ